MVQWAIDGCFHWIHKPTRFHQTWLQNPSILWSREALGRCKACFTVGFVQSFCCWFANMYLLVGGLEHGIDVFFSWRLYDFTFWLVVWNIFLFSISYMGCHPSHWRSYSYFSRWLLHQPDLLSTRNGESTWSAWLSKPKRCVQKLQLQMLNNHGWSLGCSRIAICSKQPLCPDVLNI